MNSSPDVVVVGGGVVGASVAYYLSLEGAKVQLLDREALGSGCSFHGTGMAVAMLGSMLQGPALPINRASRHLLTDLCLGLTEETGVDTLYQERGYILTAFDEKELAQRRENMEYVNARGTPVSWLDPSQVLELEPRLNPAVLGAAYEDGAAQVDGYRLTLAFAAAAEKRGTTVRHRQVTGLSKKGSRITAVLTEGGPIPCDNAVIAMGAWSRAVSEWIGFPLPVKPIKGQTLRLRFLGTPPEYFINYLKLGTVVPRRDDLVSCGTSFEDVNDSQPTEEFKMATLMRALELLPVLEEAEIVHHLAGVRPMSPDSYPILGPVPGWEGLHLATGHGLFGIQLAPITGKVVSELVLHGRATEDLPMEAYSPERFADYDLTQDWEMPQVYYEAGE